MGPGIERVLGRLRCSAPSSERCGCGWPLASEPRVGGFSLYNK